MSRPRIDYDWSEFGPYGDRVKALLVSLGYEIKQNLKPGMRAVDTTTNKLCIVLAFNAMEARVIYDYYTEFPIFKTIEVHKLKPDVRAS